MIRRLQRSIPVAAAFASLGGCMPTAPQQRAEFMEPPSMSRTIAASGVKSVSTENGWPSTQWWRAFRSAELDAVIGKSLLGNQGLRKAADTLKDAEAAVDIAGSRLTPYVEADLSYKQYRYAEHGVAAGLNPLQGGKQKSAAFLNPISAKWELDFWGKNRALLDAAIGDALAQAGELEQTRLLLTTSVARAYLRGYILAEQLKLAKELTGLRRELRQLAETRYQTGIEILDIVQLARSNEEAAVRREAALTAAIEIQENALARLMGEGPDVARGLFARRKSVAPAQPALPSKLPIELLAHRPDLMAALRRAEAWAERIHAAKAMFLPSIDLSVSAGLEASVTSTQFAKLGGYLFNPGAMVYSVTPGLHLPIFQGGKLTGNLESQRADYDQAVDAYNETLLTAAQQVADALATLKRARAEHESQGRFIRARRAEVELARIRLRGGLQDRREFIQQHADTLDAVFIQRGIEGDRLVATVDLFQALGGGYDAGPQAHEPRPAPESDPITPVVDVVQSLGGG
ncbi:efflux transporter outer membrane subunit [Methylocystis sp. Sn-Cys]|uniref:efflux transporter outer membrane subunit n=1 Tax=Methylocystis sp. Sn-Cys TaxID=1701263 RepID=UPI0019241017|nr:efflux transporter outer membrane subunit [Methylocystis sp. Sn-Cys]MBL1257760.1 efflux transporter outer membrane subunit [Methylocystis sp. Sn-Cys]